MITRMNMKSVIAGLVNTTGDDITVEVDRLVDRPLFLVSVLNRTRGRTGSREVALSESETIHESLRTAVKECIAEISQTDAMNQT